MSAKGNSNWLEVCCITHSKESLYSEVRYYFHYWSAYMVSLASVVGFQLSEITLILIFTGNLFYLICENRKSKHKVLT
jgi:hypothetical protein